jgi:hypothetical protein
MPNSGAKTLIKLSESDGDMWDWQMEVAVLLIVIRSPSKSAYGTWQLLKLISLFMKQMFKYMKILNCQHSCAVLLHI